MRNEAWEKAHLMLGWLAKTHARRKLLNKRRNCYYMHSITWTRYTLLQAQTDPPYNVYAVFARI